jgi:hypothetical protein
MGEREYTDLSHFPNSDDAIEQVFADYDCHREFMLLVANRYDQPTGFGAVIRRDEIPNYEAAAKVLLEQMANDPDDSPEHRLVIMMAGGVEERDETLITGLIYATARQFWMADNRVAEQIAGARVGLTPDETTCEWEVERH